MKYKKFYTGKYDIVFKMVLCSEENKYLLQEFLSRILNKKVEVIKYLRNELPISNVNNKLRNVDLLVKADEEYIHIELNNGIGKYLHVRNYGYFTTIYNSHVKRGESYDVDTKFIHLDFTYGIKDKEDYRIYKVQDKEEKKYVENFEIIEYNMDKIMKYWYDEDRKKIEKYKHLIMLDLKDKELEKIAKGDKFMKEYENKLNKLNEEEEFQSWMSYEEDQKE